MTKTNLLIAGHVCIDKNTINGVQRESWGSTAMYVHNYLKNFDDINAFILAPYGKDFTPYLNSADIVNKSDDIETMVYENIVEKGRRAQYCRNYQGIQLPEITNKIKNKLLSAEIAIIAPMTNDYSVTYVKRILRHTSNSCLKALLPQGYMRAIESSGRVRKRQFKEVTDLLSEFDIIILSEEDIDDALNQALKWTMKHPDLSVVITRAEKGATLVKNNTTINIPTKPIPFSEIKNPIGSGDIFSANLCIALKQNLNDPVLSVDVANKKTGAYLIKTI